MRKILFLICFAAGFFNSEVIAQLNITLENIEVNASGDVASVNVVVNSGFTNLYSTQMSFSYDTLHLQFQDVSGMNTTLGLSSNNFSGPNGAGVKNGQVTFSWQDGQTPKTIANGTSLFRLNFKTLGAKCTQSQVSVGNKPLSVEIIGPNFMELTLNSTPSTVKVKCDGTSDPCVDPACSNPANFTLIGGLEEGVPGSTVCVPISVKNFKNMENGQGAITWDASKLKYKSKVVPGVLPRILEFNEADSLSGKLIYIWYIESGDVLTLPDETVIFELCFEVLGTVGDAACINLGLGVPTTIWGATGQSEVPICYQYGQVNVISNSATTKLNVGANSGKKGETVCVDVSVDEFKNVVAANAAFTWNPAELKYISTGSYNLTGLKQTDFNLVANNGVPDSKLNFLWQTSSDPVSKTNGEKIFQLCFQLLDCPKTAQITVASTEIIGDGPITLPSTGTNGSITISCDTTVDPCVITPGAITNVSCFGMQNGAATMTVTNATGCMCQWKDASGSIIRAAQPVSSGCNLSGVGAGSYTLEVLCAGAVSCTSTITITQPTAINIPTFGNITNVNCGQKGAIDITGTSGGTSPYTFAWNPNLGNVANPTNLDAGVYAVTVTDTKSCTATASFTVGTSQTNLTLTGTSANVKCFGGTDGSITLTINGGCTPYTTAWTGGLIGANPQTLKAGTYTVTVSDAGSPIQTATATFTITQPSQAVAIAVTGVTMADNGVSNGSITLDITGGTPNYKTNWSAGNNNATDIVKTTTAVNLAPGTYNVTVTDANGCTSVQTGIIVGEKGTEVIKPVIGSVTTSNYNGSGVTCFNGSDGALNVVLTAGTTPVDVRILSGTTVVKVVQMNSLSFTITDLKAGSYIVEVKNSAGLVLSSPIELTQPTKLVAQPTIQCTDKDEDTGSITLNANNTGTAPYNYNWSATTDIDNTIENLGVGVYNVTVTDTNNCTVTISNMEIEVCSSTGGPDCFESTDIITPNGDRVNDFFVISCIDQVQTELTIFDRWGKVVYSDVNYDNTWYGLDSEGKDLPEGSYIWVLTVYNDNGTREVYKNTMTILR
ncbi:MAG: gliding motility-associated C-terminal domain-containing protein [Saprospiraceae bacterium]